jgi:hypothetical protein
MIMALVGIITQDVPDNTESIAFNNPDLIDSISFTTNKFTYPVSGAFTLSKSDFQLFFKYKTQFYYSIIANFPSITNVQAVLIPPSQWRILNSSAPNIMTYNQTTTATNKLVYNMTCDKTAKTVGFQARTESISISAQEYLMAFTVLTCYANQVALI